MSQYPYTQNLSGDRSFYSPSLQDKGPQPTTWTSRQAPDFYSESHPISGLVKAGAVVGGTFAAGFIKTKNNGRVWDYYTKGLRGIEEFSPGGMLRTFQLSNIASQFESTNLKGFSITGQELTDNPIYREYLKNLIGQKSGDPDTANRLIKEGVNLKGGKLYWGDTGEVALKYASSINAPEGTGAHFGSGFARSIGLATPDGKTQWRQFREMPLHEFFGKQFPFGEHGRFSQVKNPAVEGTGTVRQIIGAHNPLQYAWRQAAGLGTEYVSRFNRLLKAPFELEPFKTVFGAVQKGLKKVTGRELQFAVKEGPGLKMFGSLAAKYGGAATAIYMGYQTVDYMFRNSELLDNTLFEEGVTHGIATLGVKSNLLLSQAAEATGLHKYRETQEEIAPGSTSLTKLAAFPLIGGLGMGFASYGATVAGMIKHPGDAATARVEVVERLRSFQGSGPLQRLGQQFSDPAKLFAKENKLGKILQKVAIPKQFATASGDLVTELSYKMLGRLGPTKVAASLGMLAGAALTLPFLPGALVPSTRPDELQKIYSGEQEVAIRKGRWWEFGRSAYEGQRIIYNRPHWYPRMKIRAGEKGVYGDEELSPLSKFIKKEFTYDLEKENYAERPYPMTALPFEDVPFIGPLLAHTVGRMIKPPRYMHEEEWRRGEEVKQLPPRFGERVASEIGELPGGVPLNPNGIKGLIGEQAYRLTEMIGLPGFVMTSIKEKLTGTSDLFDQQAQLETSRRMFGAERAYWDLEVGGGLGSTEALRRLFPHRRRQIPSYNPIRNTMPEWLPGPGEKSEDFLHGDPFTKVQEGELRLPGKGYEARFKELEGVSPEKYPVEHQYRILADVAPYTDKFKMLRRQVQVARKQSNWDERKEKIYQDTEAQVKAKKVRIEFNDYKHLSPMGNIEKSQEAYGANNSSELLATLNKAKANQEPGDSGGVVSRLFGGYWELIAHNAETAMDQMTPASPGAKLVHMRTPIESYEREQLYGTANAFWNHPLRDFLKPAAQLTAKAFGFDEVPGHIQDRRKTEEYFDMLTYTKNTKLANMARAAGDTQGAQEFENNKDQTLFGINPFTQNFGNILRALPHRDRNYFESFSNAGTPKERSRILEMVPDNEKPLYMARWKLGLADNIRQAQKIDILTERETMEADATLENIYNDASNEGMPTSKELFAEYVETRAPNESYADWYRRTKLLSQYNIPGADWVGWHPSVDLQDIKLKVVQNMGEDMHDYDMWPNRAQQLLNKPFITDAAIEPIMDQERYATEDIRGKINHLLLSNDVRPSIRMNTTFGKNHQSNLTIDMEHDRDVSDMMKDML